MVDITHKSSTLRTATAQATLVASVPETIQAIIDGTVPKGNVLEIARAAGLFAVKKTPEMIPDCHIIPIEYTSIEYDIQDTKVVISLTVKTIYKTGVEVEAMHAVSVVALTMYDMLKPIDKGIEIHAIKLLEKKGGKSDYKDKFREEINAAVIVCSDSISAGHKEDRAGKEICANLESHKVKIEEYTVIPDEFDVIQAKVKEYQSRGIKMIIFTGGTGLSGRDVSPEAITPLLERRIPGIEEAIRSYGQQRTPYSMLSRSVCGSIGGSMILALPGSTNGAKESMQAIMPAALHVFHIMKGGKH